MLSKIIYRNNRLAPTVRKFSQLVNWETNQPPKEQGEISDSK